MRLSTLLFILAFAIICYSSCTKDGASADAAGGTGTGGSLARFTIAGNYLYLADYSTIEVFDINNPQSPVKKASIPVGFGVETIFPYKDKLFIGSRDGMFIYSLANPAKPQLLGSAQHVRSCDPVVANDSIAYVTLKGGRPCGPVEDGLYVYNITNITKPQQTALLKLSTPEGLGLKDSVVFVCRGQNGLSAVNVKVNNSPKVMYTLTDADYKDVIPMGDVLICYVATGLLLYDISNLNKITTIGTFQY